MGADVRRVVLASTRHREILEQRVAPALLAWAAQWCLAGADTAWVEVVEAGWPLAGEAAGLLDMAHCADGDAWLMATEAQWRQAVFGPAMAWVPDDELVGRLLARARIACLAAVQGALGRSGWQACVPALPTAAGGQLHVAMRVNAAHFWLCIDAGVLEAELPPAVATAPPLASREAGIGAASVELRVEIPLLRLGMAEFMGLRVGDVVRGEPGLDAFFTVKVGERALPLRAALGAQAGRKAIRLDS